MYNNKEKSDEDNWPDIQICNRYNIIDFKGTQLVYSTKDWEGPESPSPDPGN